VNHADIDAGNRTGFLPVHRFKGEKKLMKKIFAPLPLYLFTLAAALFPSSTANAATNYFATCPVSEVAVLENRIHVRCTNPNLSGPSGGIIYFAVPTSSSTNVARFLTVFTSALVENRKLTILYDDFEISGQEFGCLIENCRVAHGAFLGLRQ
jgi:hypothetical protein